MVKVLQQQRYSKKISTELFIAKYCDEIMQYGVYDRDLGASLINHGAWLNNCPI
jgi:hypothetical protein